MFGKKKKKLDKILLPIIRDASPSLMAKDLVGVQPMTGPAGNVFSMRKVTKRDTAKWIKRFAVFVKLSSGRWIFFKHVWDLTYQEPGGDNTVFETVDSEELIIKKLKGETNGV